MSQNLQEQIQQLGEIVALIERTPKDDAQTLERLDGTLKEIRDDEVYKACDSNYVISEIICSKEEC
jgi:hypothetical protein